MKPGRPKEFPERIQVNLCLPKGATRAFKRAAREAKLPLASWMRLVLLEQVQFSSDPKDSGTEQV